MNYKIISNEDELLIESTDLNDIKSSFMNYVSVTKQDYVKEGLLTEMEILEDINSIKTDLENEVLFNQHLIDYGFQTLIKEA